METLRILSEAGVPTGLALAPMVPRLGVEGLAEHVAAAAAAGARYAFAVLLRLPAEVLPVFRHRLEEVLPESAGAVLAALEEMRAGNLQESRFGQRMRGVGARFQAIHDLFALLCRKHGLLRAGDEGLEGLRPRPRQALLFDEPGP
jgi:DNA repair photolyase